MPPSAVWAATNPKPWTIRKEGRYWVLRKRGHWHLTTSYWWLAMWLATRDRRHIPPEHAAAIDLARLAGY